MTDRIAGITVTLQPNMREDDAESLMQAIRQLRGVVSVQAHVADLAHHFAVEQAKTEYMQRILKVLNDRL